LAVLWRKQFEADNRLTQARIAAREGFSRARVTQILDLLQLPNEVQDGLIHPPAPLEIQSFSERRLRSILSCGSTEVQLQQWHDLVRDLINSQGE